MVPCSQDISRHVRRAAGVHMHYRAAGAATLPALVLLHPSPRSSAMYEPWMQQLCTHFHVLAIDTPGYGGSDPLPVPPQSLHDYVPVLADLLHAVAGPRFVLYGSATGAQLGIALANAHPARVAHLVLDNAAHFDDDTRSHMLAHYFPDLSPRADGSHLATAWRMCAQMLEFFPWFEADAAHRIAPRPPTAAEVHAALSELLAAGPGWAAAYRAAFAHERAAHVQALTVPTTLLRWQGSILLPHINRLLRFALPLQLQVLDIPAPMAERFAAMTAHLRSLIGAARAH